jgi:hypothetical protein
MGRCLPVLAMAVVAALASVPLAGCGHGAAAPGEAAAGRATTHPAGPPGSPGNPLVLSCGAEAWPGYPDRPVRVSPGPRDLAAGPVYFAGGRTLATETPAQFGYAPFGRHGRAYKIGFVVRPGAAVTVTIAAAARGHAVIDNGASSVAYHACRTAGGFFAQNFAFTHRPFRGCVPLDVTAGGQPRVRHVTLSLFAGPCGA